MNFSQPTVADYLNEHFECAWTSVRKVPKVYIDFGDGTTLERTMLGNIATWFCFSDGVAFDVQPGLVDSGEFLRRAKQAVGAARALGREEDRHAAVTRYHEQALARIEAAKHRPAESTDPQRDREAIQVKRRVEQPILSKTPAVTSRKPAALTDVTALQSDTRNNRRFRYPLAHALMAAQPRPVTPTNLAHALFEKVLEIPLQDPFLGLAPRILGGEGGRTLHYVPIR